MPQAPDRSARVPRKIDLDFRPETYFLPLNLEAYVLSHVSGFQRREMLRAALDDNEIDTVCALLTDSELEEALRERLFKSHPVFLSGEFLPRREEGEVEIARITLDSTTYDVTCVYARFEDGIFHFRVVDEYEGETLSGPARCTSDKPLTLGELVEFFDCAWPLMKALKMNFPGDLRGMLGFFRAEPAFYPHIDALYRRRVRAAYRARRAAVRSKAQR